MRLGPIVNEVAKELQGKLKVVKVNTAHNPVTTSACGVRAIPMLLIFKDGESVASELGYKSKEELLEFVKPHLQ
jgi:thioredoxin 1